MYSFLRRLLFLLDPEIAHHVALTALDYIPAACLGRSVEGTPIKAMGLSFPHRIGLAAGLDKNARYVDGLSKLGFSFIEVGTVTPKAQEGNPKPRLFRLPEAHALINRMGFNNQGVETLVENVKRMHYQGVLGINIGKNKQTSLNHAIEDYTFCLKKVYAHASYIAINISSPNTPDLRCLQQADYLGALVHDLRQEQLRLCDTHQRYVPLVVKISPDETEEALKRIADTLLNAKIDGVIATNTTASRPLRNLSSVAHEQGGLSGSPLLPLSTSCITLLKSLVGDDMTLIGVGGIDHEDAAQALLGAGATLLQVYTGLIYQGPGLVSRLSRY